LERLGDRGLGIDEVDQPLVGDDDQSVDDLAERGHAFFGRPPPAAPLELERLRHHPDGQRPRRLGGLGDDRRGACPGASAHAGGDEDHVGAVEHLDELLGALLGGALSDLGPSTGPQTLGQLVADADRERSLGGQQRLGIGVDRHEVDPLDARRDHAIHGVAAGASDPDNFDPGKGNWRAQHRRILPARSTRHRFGSIRAGGHRLTTLAPSDDRTICNAVDPNTLTPARGLSSGLLHRSSHPAPLRWATPG
jgi:hypothetical protein